MSQPVIVYAEDMKGVRQITQTVLEHEGFKVRSHENGKKALDDILHLTEAGQSAILLTDHDMPDMTGVELVGALKEHFIRIPTIVMSANDQIEQKLKDADVLQDVDSVLQKPMDIRILRQVLAQFAGQDKKEEPRRFADLAKSKDTGPRNL